MDRLKMISESVKVKGFIHACLEDILNHVSDLMEYKKSGYFILFAFMFNMKQSDKTSFHHRYALHQFGRHIKKWPKGTTYSEKIKMLEESKGSIKYSKYIRGFYADLYLELVKNACLTIMKMTEDDIVSAVERALAIREKLHERNLSLRKLPILEECLYSSLGIFGYLKYQCTFLINTLDEYDFVKCKLMERLMAKFHQESYREILETLGYIIGSIKPESEMQPDKYSNLLELAIGERYPVYIQKVDNEVNVSVSDNGKSTDYQICIICGKKSGKIAFPVAYDESRNDDLFPRRQIQQMASWYETGGKIPWIFIIKTVCSRICWEQSRRRELGRPTLEVITEDIVKAEQIPKTVDEIKSGFLAKKYNLLVFQYRQKEFLEPIIIHDGTLNNSRFESFFYIKNREQGTLLTFDCSIAFPRKSLDLLLNNAEFFSIRIVSVRNNSPFAGKGWRQKSFFCCPSDNSGAFLSSFVKKKPENPGNLAVQLIIFDEKENTFKSLGVKDFEYFEKCILTKVIKSGTFKKIQKYHDANCTRHNVAEQEDTIENKMNRLTIDENSAVLHSNIEDKSSSNMEDKNSLNKEDEDSLNKEEKNSWKKICWHCAVKDTEVELSKCKGCLKARYCSEKCQADDWERHQSYCIKKQEKRRLKESQVK